jgi:hypothetical protein
VIYVSKGAEHQPEQKGARPPEPAQRASARASSRAPSWADARGPAPAAGLVGPTGLQARLEVGAPNDPFEQEAERVAEQVLRTAEPAAAPPPLTPGGPPALRRACACGGAAEEGGECAACRARRLSVQRQAAAAAPAAAPPSVHATLRAPGAPLDQATRAFMEPRLGADLGAVRLHTDRQAAESARAVGALAYTVGSRIAFGAGQYQPHTAPGRRLLAHELAHTLQQSAAPGEGPVRLRGERRISRVQITIRTAQVNFDYGNVASLPVADYVATIEAMFAGWAGVSASGIHAGLVALSPDQQRWVLWGLDLLIDNTGPAQAGLDRQRAVERLIARAPTSTIPPTSPPGPFEQEVLEASGWFEVTLPATLVAPTGADLATIHGLYNPPQATPSGALQRVQLDRQLRPALTALVEALDPGRRNVPASDSFSTLQPIADLIQTEARSFFAPYADTAANNPYARGWLYSANLFDVSTRTTASITQDDRLGYLLNRAEIVGRIPQDELVSRTNAAVQGTSVNVARLVTLFRRGGFNVQQDVTGAIVTTAPRSDTIFGAANYDSSNASHRAFLLQIVEVLEALPGVRAAVNRLIQHTGVTQRSTGRVGIDPTYNAAVRTECQARWRTIGTLSHELVHVLVHPTFPTRASSVRFGQIVREGFTEVLGVQLYDHLRTRAAADATFRASLEAGLASAPCPPMPAGTIGYGAAGAGAKTIRSTVGDANFRAAYFLGDARLVGL